MAQAARFLSLAGPAVFSFFFCLFDLSSSSAANFAYAEQKEIQTNIHREFVIKKEKLLFIVTLRNKKRFVPVYPAL